MADNPVALVTGAGSGIGRAACELLAGAQWRLALVGRTESTLQETMDGMAAGSAAPPDMLAIPADVGDQEQAMSCVDMTRDRFGRLDALINNAGAAELVPIERTDESLLYRMFSVNAFGPAHLIARAWPLWKAQKGGCVVNVSSMASSDPFPGFFAYAAAKSALESLARSVVNEGRDFGMRAFSVAPGAVETRALRRLFSERDLPQEQALDPRDVAHVVCDCVLGRRDGDNGRTITVPSP